MTKHFDNPSAYSFQSDKNRKKQERRRRTLPGYPLDWPLETRAEVEAYFAADRIVCLKCGKRYNSLNSHLKVHGITVEDYQTLYGLPHSVGLVGNLYRETLRARAIQLRDDGVFSLKPPPQSGSAQERAERPIYRINEMREHAKSMRSPKGEAAGSAKLTEECVRKIKADTIHTHKELAEIYGTTATNIQQIMSGKTWKHITTSDKRPKYVQSLARKKLLEIDNGGGNA